MPSNKFQKVETFVEEDAETSRRTTDVRRFPLVMQAGDVNYHLMTQQSTTVMGLTDAESGQRRAIAALLCNGPEDGLYVPMELPDLDRFILGLQELRGHVEEENEKIRREQVN